MDDDKRKLKSNLANCTTCAIGLGFAGNHGTDWLADFIDEN